MFDDADAPLSRREFRTVVGATAAGALASIVAIIATRRFLYADSSAFLLGMWESGSFFIPNQGRWFGFAVTQWLPVLAMKLGVTDPGWLTTLFGINLWMNPVLAVIVAWWASGRSREITLVTLLCVLFLFQSTYVAPWRCSRSDRSSPYSSSAGEATCATTAQSGSGRLSPVTCLRAEA